MLTHSGSFLHGWYSIFPKWMVLVDQPFPRMAPFSCSQWFSPLIFDCPTREPHATLSRDATDAMLMFCASGLIKRSLRHTLHRAKTYTQNRSWGASCQVGRQLTFVLDIYHAFYWFEFSSDVYETVSLLLNEQILASRKN